MIAEESLNEHKMRKLVQLIPRKKIKTSRLWPGCLRALNLDRRMLSALPSALPILHSRTVIPSPPPPLAPQNPRLVANPRKCAGTGNGSVAAIDMKTGQRSLSHDPIT
jgi:hypothetical protein